MTPSFDDKKKYSMVYYKHKKDFVRNYVYIFLHSNTTKLFFINLPKKERGSLCVWTN